MIDDIRRGRIRISVFACAYEMYDTSLLSDTEYDKLALSIDTTTRTDNTLMDDFFRDEYRPYTGSWVYNHPELGKLRLLTLEVLRCQVK